MKKSLFMDFHFFSYPYLSVICIDENDIFHIRIVSSIFFFQKSSCFFFLSSIMRTILIKKVYSYTIFLREEINFIFYDSYKPI